MCVELIEDHRHSAGAEVLFGVVDADDFAVGFDSGVLKSW